MNSKQLLNGLFLFVNRSLLSLVEYCMAPGYDEALSHRPVFILGAPRSGSTLVYQTITEAFDVGYMSNAHCLLFGAPALADRFLRLLSNRPESDYQSVHGVTGGPHAPSECGPWWYRFFRRSPVYVSLADVDENRMRRFRRAIAHLSKVLDKPVIFKNLYASLRLRPIIAHVPEALFIIIERDEVETGHSLLEVRKSRFGSYDKWWSVKPEGLPDLDSMPPFAQVIEQVRRIRATIDRDLRESGIPSDRTLRLGYRGFCNDVHAALAEIDAFLKRHGSVATVDVSCIPGTFQVAADVRISKTLYDDMVAYAKKTY